MDNYVVSARKYRPTNFDDVIGQDHITTTLKNSIKNNKVAQSLLFCGPRGVGKTTCARIVAKMVNNIESNDPLENQNNLNIYELDAASNNSVDDIRNLIDQVRYAPQSGKFKVYIIDEVHMLSNAAFNAFLKTLEEPPSYAIFILATTEKQKVIPTILSRCQIHDFNRIEINDIKNRLKKITDLEGITSEDDALHIIAQKADGALRDALSILDLMITYNTGNKITYESVINNLHILDYDYFFKTADEILNHNSSSCILILDEILKLGFESNNFITGLSEHFRNLLICKDDDIVEILEVSDGVKSKYKEQSSKLSKDLLINSIDILNSFDINYKLSSNTRLHAELALVKLCNIGGENSENNKEAINTIKKSSPKKENKKLKEENNSPSEEKETEVIDKNVEKITEESETKETPNLNTILSKETKKNEIEEIEITESTEEIIKEVIPDFNQNNLKELIKNYIDSKNVNNSKTSILSKELAIEKKNIHLILSSDLEKEIFEDLKNDLLNEIRTHFDDQKIDFSIKIEENNKAKKLYTGKEKFEFLIEKNKEIKNLQNQLGLDYEY